MLFFYYKKYEEDGIKKGTMRRGSGSYAGARGGGGSSTFITGTDLTERGSDAIVPFAPALHPGSVPRGGYAYNSRGSREKLPSSSTGVGESSSWQLSVDVNNRPSLMLQDSGSNLDDMEQLRRMVARTRKTLDNRMSEMKNWRKDVDCMRKDVRKGRNLAGEEVLEDDDTSDEDQEENKKRSNVGGNMIKSNSHSSQSNSRRGSSALALMDNNSSSSSTILLQNGGGLGRVRRGSGKLPPLESKEQSNMVLSTTYFLFLFLQEVQTYYIHDY